MKVLRGETFRRVVRWGDVIWPHHRRPAVIPGDDPDLFEDGPPKADDPPPARKGTRQKP